MIEFLILFLQPEKLRTLPAEFYFEQLWVQSNG